MTNWINTVSREHVRRAVEGKFTQADHGKPDRLRRMSNGDRIAFYSPKTDYPDGEPLQAFTAIGRLVGDEVYPVEMSPDLQMYRRNVEFLACAETPIKPLIDELNFIEDKKRWGFRFRFGLFQVSDHDFEVIQAAMTRRLAGADVSVA
ncbi:EVE domain-containing protein [soil metagenome]